MTEFFAAFFSGAAGAMGLGGGTVLILYLTACAGYGQPAAQGINLLFFLACSAVSLVFHGAGGYVRWKTAGLCVLAGLPAVWAGFWISGLLGPERLQDVFAIFLLALGLQQIFGKNKNTGK
ncbi:MAG TPA: sulfite exporter TauE/SafE family protein [Oscillospiraceae bacterium]|nr:sulfite exporter TauE/SafE family protein [Oscillospiraceae bacterium]HNW04663.1 sulfite exporter TauE/SafE family protein [Oscillospiraceae bacterium]HPV99632.1 sulfite exporter TauE/SafE family protein [Oscillospiraceae bacterium]